MCFVAFQKIFQKIFSGVWKRRRKTQIQKNTSHNPEKNHQRRQIQSDDRAVNRDLAFFARSQSTARSREASIAISDLPLLPTYEISRSTLREIALLIAISIRRDLAKARSRSTARSRDGKIAFDASRDRAVDRDLARSRSQSTARSLSSRDRDRWHDLAKRRSQSRIAVVELELARSARIGARSSPAIVGLTRMFLLLSRALSLSLSHFPEML